MENEYKKYSQTDYYWILEFLDKDYERSSYKKNGADLVLKMNDAKDINELLKIRKEIHNFIESHNIGRHLVNQNALYPLTANKMDKFINRCFNGNVVRLIGELPSDEMSIDKALRLYVNSYYIDPETDKRITEALRNKFGNSISGKLTDVEGVKMEYLDCLNKYKDDNLYPKGSNGKKKLLEKYNSLQKELKGYGYVLHIYDVPDTSLSDIIIVIIGIAVLIIIGVIVCVIFYAIGRILTIVAMAWLISLAFGRFMGR